LSAFFWMLTLCLYVYYTEKPVIRRYLLVLFCFACALMSKPMVITLPIVIILLDYWPLDRLQSRKIVTNMPEAMPVSTNQGKKKNKLKQEALKKNISPPNEQKLSEPRIAGIIPLWQLKEKIPFFVLSAVMVIITLYNPHAHDMQDNRDLQHYSLISRLANTPVAFVTYLEKTFWPHDMAIFYPFSDQIPLWQVLGASFLILVISVAVIVMMKRLPYLFAGWMWYAITIAPVIGIIQVSAAAPYAIADRYHYLPSIGLGVMIAWGMPALIKSEGIRKKFLFPAGIAIIFIMAVLTWQQCGYWKNSITLFSHALQVTKNNCLAHNNLGLALFTEGKIEEAIYHYNKAILIKPITAYHALAYNNRGVVYNKLGQPQLALDDYTKAISLQPDNFMGYYNRGNIYNKLGEDQRALMDYNQAIRLKSDFADAYYNRGFAYAKRSQYQMAIEDYNQAIRLRSDFADAYYNRGFVYAKRSQYQMAIEDFNETIRLKQDYGDAYVNRGFAYLSMGNNNLGCLDVQKACELGVCIGLEWAKGKGLCR
jgi:tetratricopeptide (TPR) repeat protein